MPQEEGCSRAEGVHRGKIFANMKSITLLFTLLTAACAHPHRAGGRSYEELYAKYGSSMTGPHPPVHVLHADLGLDAATARYHIWRHAHTDCVGADLPAVEESDTVSIDAGGGAARTPAAALAARCLATPKCRAFEVSTGTLKSAACVAGMKAAPAGDLYRLEERAWVADAEKAGADQYWWLFDATDCGYDDVPGSCAGQTVAGCKATCLATQGPSSKMLHWALTGQLGPAGWPIGLDSHSRVVPCKFSVVQAAAASTTRTAF